MKYRYFVALLSILHSLLHHIESSSVIKAVFWKRTNEDIPDLNVRLASPSDTEAHPVMPSTGIHFDHHATAPASDAIEQEHHIPEITGQGQIKDRPLSEEEKRKRKSARQSQRNKEWREQFKNRHQLGFSEEKIAKLEQQNHRRLEQKKVSMSRRYKAAWGRHRAGEATKSDMTIIERSRRTSKEWRNKHLEQDNKRKQDWRVAQREKNKKIKQDKS